MTASSRSRRTIVVASFLFLLIVVPVGSQIPTRSQAPSQRFDPRIFSPRGTRPPRTDNTIGSVEVRLTPDKERVRTGEPVKFTATLSPPLRDVFYTFETEGRGIGEGMDMTQAEWRFSTPGPHVITVHVRIHGTTLTDSTTILVDEDLRVQLSADRPQARVGEPVRFRARLSRPLSGLFYEFREADGKVIGSGVDQTEVVGQFLRPGSHVVNVHVRVRGTQVTDSKTIQIVQRSNPTPSATALAPITPVPPSPYAPSPTAIVTGGSITATRPPTGSNVTSPTATASVPITPSPTSPYAPSSPIATAAPTVTPFISTTTPPPLRSSKMLWLYIAVGFGVVSGLAYLIYAKWKPEVAIAARPTFHPHADWDAPQKPPKNLAINYELAFHPNVSAGQGRVDTHGASLIQQRKKQ